MLFPPTFYSVNDREKMGLSTCAENCATLYGHPRAAQLFSLWRMVVGLCRSTPIT